MQNKNLWFCPTTEDKKVKLLLTTQQNQSSVILFSYTDVKDKLNFPEAVIGHILKKKKQRKQSCSKSCS